MRSPVLGRKKRLNVRFPILICNTISDKPFEYDSRAMKIRVKVAYSCLTLSKNPPPFPNPGYAPDAKTEVIRQKSAQFLKRLQPMAAGNKVACAN